MRAAGYAACAWALLFAATNIYWGLGGRLAAPISDPDAALADPTFVALNWLAVALKASPGLVALVTVQSRAWVIPRRLLLLATCGLGIGMALYGTLGLLLDGLRLLVDCPLISHLNPEDLASGRFRSRVA